MNSNLHLSYMTFSFKEDNYIHNSNLEFSVGCWPHYNILIM